MYRIEVVTGEATVFRTVEELATGIRNGLITPSSRIWHGASQKWLPIDIHPHYKKALDLVTGGAPMIDTGLTRPAPRRTPTPAPAPAPAPSPAPASVPASAPSPASVAPRSPEPRATAPARRPEPPSFSPSPAPAPAAPQPSPSAWLEPAPDPEPVVPAPQPAARPVEPAGFPRLAPHPFAAPAATAAFEPAEQESAVLTVPPPVAADDGVALPTISYPEVPPPSPAELFHPVARRRPGGRTSFMLGGVAAIAIVGGYLALRSDSPAADTRAEPAPTREQVAAPPQAESEFGSEVAFPEPVAAEPAAEKGAESLAPLPARAPTPVEAKPPAPSRGFTPLPRATGPVSQAWSSSAGAIAPTTPSASPVAAPAPAAAEPAIAPPPAAIDLSLPRLPKAETVGVAAEAKRDSVALKQILRAVSGRQAGGKSTR